MGRHAKSKLSSQGRSGLPALAATVLVVLAGANRVTYAQSSLNKMCPVMTLEEADPAFVTEYQGKTVAFCCERCLRKFKANPARYVAHLSALQGNKDNQESGSKPKVLGQNAHEHEGEDVAEHAHREVGPDGTGEQNEDHSHADHETGNATDTSGPAKLIGWFGRFHPSTVHFPIGMLFGAATAEVLYITSKRQHFAIAGRFCLWFGGLAAIVAGVLGWCYAGFRLTDDNWILTTHRWLGTATVLWALATLVLGERASRAIDASNRVSYRALLFVGAVAVLATGFFGGAMIYGIDHYAW